MCDWLIRLGLFFGLLGGMLPSVQAQDPFVCDGDFILSLTPAGQGTVSSFYKLTVDANGSANFSILPNTPASDAINAIGYRSTDNFVYGVNPGTQALYRIDSSGASTFLAFLTGINTSYNYFSGACSPDGDFLILLGGSGGDMDMVKVDLNDPNYGTSIIPLTTLSTGNAPTNRTADIAFNPYSGKIYGYYGNTGQLITINPITGVVDDVSFPAGQVAQTLGTIFFNAFGEIYGYGRPVNGNLQNTLFKIDSTSGVVSIITSGPNANGTDGCACPYTIEMQKRVAPADTVPCSPIVYTFIIANASGTVQNGIDFVDVMDPDFVVSAVMNNPYGGTVSGIGTNTLSITNMSIPLGVDSFTVEVYVDTLAAGLYSNQARLSNLPLALGESVISDDPASIVFEDSTEVLISPLIVDLPNQTMEFCTGDSLVLDASVYDGVLYQWSDGTTSPTLTVKQGGQYWVIASGCEIVYDTIDVIEHSLPQVIASADTAICAGDQANLSASGALTYQWIPATGLNNANAANPLASPNDTTLYQVIGTDSFGCVNRDSVQVVVRPLPGVNAGPDLALCHYDSLVIGLSNPPGNYLWSPAQNLAQPASPQTLFTPTGPGTFSYTLTATGPEGCTQSDGMTVTVHDLQVNFIQSEVLCFGNANGASTIQVAVGGAPYQFLWRDSAQNLIQNLSGPIPNQTLNTLTAGNYLAQVIDANGCTDSLAFTISQPAPLQISILNQVNVDCFGNNNGSVDLGASGGTPAYEYAFAGGNFGTVSSFGNLAASQYPVQLRDANGCQDSLTVTIITPTGLYANIISQKNVDCFGNSNGAVRLQGFAATPPYEYSRDGNTYVSNPLLGNLAAGPDTFWVRDGNGCLVSLPIQITEPPVLTVGILQQRNVACEGENNGALSVDANGGVAPYQYVLGAGSFGNSSQFDSLLAGNYLLRVRDDSLCESTLPITITEPSLLTLSLDRKRDIACFGGNSGEIDLLAAGGTPPYAYQQDSLGFGSGHQFAGLGAGSYLYTVRDDSNCVSTLAVSLSEPTLLTLALDKKRDLACNGGTSGQIWTQANGGTPPYRFTQDGSNFQSDSLFSSLQAGTYQLAVYDDSNCVAQLAVSLSQPDSLRLELLSQSNIDCFGHATGSFRVTAQGGVLPYAYGLDSLNLGASNRFDQLLAGNYTAWVRDDSSCLTPLTLTLTEPPLLELSTTHTDVLCFGDATGTASVDISGGTAPYLTQWDSEPPQESLTAIGLKVGTYQVTVIDDHGCITQATAVIDEPPLLELALVPGSIQEAHCNWANGQAAIQVTGGVPFYEFDWGISPALRDPASDSLLAGTYFPVVQDQNGCTDTLEVLVPGVPPAVAAFFTTPSHEDSILESQQPIVFHNLSEGAVAYRWDFGDGLGLSDEADPGYVYPEPGVYEVRLTAYNAYFVCPTDTSLILHIIPDGDLFIPNAFSPNDDGVNDLFFLKGEGIVTYEFHIFDRWGRQIALFTSLDQGWDGRMTQGGMAPEGVYTFTVKALLNDGTQLNRSGTITLLR